MQIVLFLNVSLLSAVSKSCILSILWGVKQTIAEGCGEQLEVAAICFFIAVQRE